MLDISVFAHFAPAISLDARPLVSFNTPTTLFFSK